MATHSGMMCRTLSCILTKPGPLHRGWAALVLDGRRRRLPFVIALLVPLFANAPAASAQPLGTSYWQLEPFCNVVALHITQQVTPVGPVYSLTGFDDQCGAVEHATIVGTATFNGDGSIGVGLTIVVSPGGAPVHVDARIILTSLSGPWADSAGNAGTFVPFSPARGDLRRDRESAVAAGVPRPVPRSVIAPGSVTAVQIAPGAVGAGQIDPLQVQSRVHENCPVGQYLRGINANGTVVCESLPQGMQGPPGPQGPPGMPATRLWARVAADGTLIGGSGVVSVTVEAPGFYSVAFERHVARCAAVAAPGALNGAYAGHRIASAGSGINDEIHQPEIILVRTQFHPLGPGTFLDEPIDFSLAVFC